MSEIQITSFGGSLVKTPERNQTPRGLGRGRAGPRGNSTTTTVPRKLAPPVSRSWGLGPRFGRPDRIRSSFRAAGSKDAAAGGFPPVHPTSQVRSRTHVLPGSPPRSDAYLDVASGGAAGRQERQSGQGSHRQGEGAGGRHVCRLLAPRTAEGRGECRKAARCLACVCVPVYMCVWCMGV